MIEEGVSALRDGDGFINPGAVGIACLEHVVAVVLQQNIFPVIHIGCAECCGLSAECFLNAPA